MKIKLPNLKPKKNKNKVKTQKLTIKYNFLAFGLLLIVAALYHISPEKTYEKQLNQLNITDYDLLMVNNVTYEKLNETWVVIPNLKPNEYYFLKSMPVILNNEYTEIMLLKRADNQNITEMVVLCNLS